MARIFWFAFALTAVGLAALTLVDGSEYFALPRMARHHAAEHALLGPGGHLGHALGIAGASLMVANLLYLVRRRWARLAALGNLSTWLSFHVALGVGGVALVFAHSALLFDNVVALVSLVAAGVVLATGVIGRWIYAQIPHRPDGQEATEAELVADLRARLTGVRPQLRTAVEDVERALVRVAAPPVAGPAAAAVQGLSTPVALLRFLAARSAWRGRLAQAPYAFGPAEAREVLAAATAAALLRRRYRRQAGVKHVVGAWRGVHRIATFVLLLTLVTHVCVVLYFSVR